MLKHLWITSTQTMCASKCPFVNCIYFKRFILYLCPKLKRIQNLLLKYWQVVWPRVYPLQMPIHLNFFFDICLEFFSHNSWALINFCIKHAIQHNILDYALCYCKYYPIENFSGAHIFLAFRNHNTKFQALQDLKKCYTF